MQSAVVIVFFALVLLLGFCPGLRNRSKRENAFYLLSILISFAALLLKSLEF